jgi:hypothetical protein
MPYISTTESEIEDPITPKSHKSVKNQQKQQQQQQHQPRKSKTIQPIEPIAEKQEYEVPEKAKTRAAKRAPETPIQEEPKPAAEKRVRRSEYLANQDELHLRRARDFKELCQTPAAEED